MNSKCLYLSNPICYLLVFLTAFAACDDAEKPQQNQTFTLSTMASPTEGGEVKVSPSGSSFDADESVSLTAEPNSNWVFQQWEEDGSGSTNPLTLTMNSNKSVTAVFVKRDYPLNLTIEGEGTVGEKIITNPSAKEYPHGTTVELTPIPAEGWVFESWGGDLNGNEVPERITVDGEKNVTVRFKEVNFIPAIPAKNMFGQPYIIPSCRLLEAYTEGSTYKTNFEYYQNGMLKQWIEIDGGVGVDTATVEYRADGLVHAVREYFNTMTMDYDSEGRLARVFLEHNSSGYRDTTEITYVGDKTVKISQRQFGNFIGDFVHEFDDNYNLIRSVLNDPSTGHIAYERTADFHSNIPNFWLSLGDFRLHFLLAGDYFDEGTYPRVASSNLIKSMSYINHYENLPERGMPGFDVLSLNDQGFPTKISIMLQEDGSDYEEVTILKYECQ